MAPPFPLLFPSRVQKLNVTDPPVPVSNPMTPPRPFPPVSVELLVNVELLMLISCGPVVGPMAPPYREAVLPSKVQESAVIVPPPLRMAPPPKKVATLLVNTVLMKERLHVVTASIAPPVLAVL